MFDQIFERSDALSRQLAGPLHAALMSRDTSSVSTRSSLGIAHFV
jgi:hypothetical protein